MRLRVDRGARVQAWRAARLAPVSWVLLRHTGDHTSEMLVSLCEEKKTVSERCHNSNSV